jgi:hypothetical protein
VRDIVSRWLVDCMVGSWRGAASWASFAGIVLLAVAPVAAEEVRWTSDGETAELVLREVLRPIDQAARANGAELLALRVVDAEGADKSLEELSEAIGNFFWDAGYEVQLLEARTEIEAGAWRLDLTVDAASVDTPDRRGSFLGLGQERVLRRAVLSVRGRLEDPESGRWYWKGAPSLQIERWVPADMDLEMSVDRPQWAGAVPSPLPDRGSAWWEKSLVAGLLAGVVTLYFNGVN